MRYVNGQIAQLVAIALHYNAALTGAKPTDFITQNSTAQYCQSLDFVREERTWFGLRTPERRVMSSPEQWFADLRQRKAVRIGVRWVTANDKAAPPDRMMAGFIGGGGVWTMQVLFSDGTYEQWLSDWRVDESRRQTDRKIWRVSYRRVYAGKQSLGAIPVAEAMTQLKQALVNIHAFSSRKDVKPFTEMFEKALNATRREAGAEGYHRDLYPEGLLEGEAAAILNAAQSAWVFGGMGSWNDMGFDGADGKEYDRVSEQLFQALLRAIPAAVDAQE